MEYLQFSLLVHIYVKDHHLGYGWILWEKYTSLPLWCGNINNVSILFSEAQMMLSWKKWRKNTCFSRMEKRLQESNHYLSVDPQRSIYVSYVYASECLHLTSGPADVISGFVHFAMLSSHIFWVTCSYFCLMKHFQRLLGMKIIYFVKFVELFLILILFFPPVFRTPACPFRMSTSTGWKQGLLY